MNSEAGEALPRVSPASSGSKPGRSKEEIDAKERMESSWKTEWAGEGVGSGGGGGAGDPKEETESRKDGSIGDPRGGARA